MKILYIAFLNIFMLLAISCDNSKTNPNYQPDEKEVEKFIEVKNRENIKIEDQQIDDYLNRRQWDFQRTNSGIRFKILQQGTGIQPQAGNLVELEYTLSLIRGEQVYSSQNSEPLRFVVDKEDVPAGLNEFVKMMKVGEKAKLIVPYYLGYGVTGDDNKIPARATLFYDLKLVKVLQ